MSKLPPQIGRVSAPEAQLGDLQRRMTTVERILQQLEGAVSPFDGSAQSGQFATGTIGGTDVGAGQLNGSHISSLGLVGLLNSSGTQLAGNTYFGSGATAILASGVSQPITAPGLALASGGSLAASTTYFVSFSWFDGTHETTCYAPATSIKTTATSLEITITLPIAPVGATQANIYMDTAAFGVGAGKLQQAIAVSSTATTTLTVTSFNAAGAASPASSSTGFTAQAAKLQPASAVDSAGSAYGWTLEGNGRARFLGPTVNSQFWLYDDFYYTSGAYPAALTLAQIGMYWNGGGFQGTASNVAQGTSASTDPGVVQMGTGSTTTGHAGIRTGSVFALGVARIRFSVYFNMNTAVPGATDSYTIILGLTTQSASGTGAGVTVAADTAIVFDFSNPASGTTFGLSVANGTTLVHKNAASQPSGSTWHFAEFEVDAGRTAISWWLDGVVQTGFTSSDLTLSAMTALMGVYLGIAKTAGTTGRTVEVDTVALFGDYVSG